MQKYYNFGDLLITLRDEYMSCNTLLEELKKYIEIKSEYENMYFTGFLTDDGTASNSYERFLRLDVEKKYNKLLKKVQELRYNWYSMYFYTAQFVFNKNEDGLYIPTYFLNITPLDGKKYVPKVEITNPEKFSNIMDQIYSSDLMQVQRGNFNMNKDGIYLDFERVHISSQIEGGTRVYWYGSTDECSCSSDGYISPSLIADILSLKLPSDRISDDWLKLLEKHESEFPDKRYNASIFEPSSNKGKYKLVLKK